MSSVRKDTLNGLKWSSIEKFSVQGVQFLLGIIMARLLSPSDYGVVGMCSIFYAISQTFIDSGFNNTLIQKKDRTEEDYCTVFYFNIVIAIIFYVLLFLAAPWIASFFHNDILKSIIRVDAITLVINALMAVQMTKLTIEVNFKAISIRSLLSSIGSGLLGVLLAYLGWGVWAIVAQGIACSLINVIFIWIYCKWIPRKSFSKESFYGMFSYGSKLLASGLINTIYSNLTTLIIGRFFSAKDLGVYSRGTSIPGLVVNNLNGGLQRVIFPILSRYQDDDEKLVYYYKQYIAIVSLCVFFSCTLLAAIGRPLVL
ncbi:lipopolysaccharide biosynthesis protein, partial [Prevotella fusca]